MATFTYSFTVADYVSPFVRNRSPAADAEDVDHRSSVLFDLLDDYSGVVANSINIWINGTLAYDGYDAYGLFSASVSPITIDGYDGYAVEITPDAPFDCGDGVLVRVVAEDREGNSLDDSWEFYTSPFTFEERGLFLRNLSPLPDATGVATSALISFDLLDKASIDAYDAYVDGAPAWSSGQQLFFYPFDGPGSSVISVTVDGYDGYRVVLDAQGTLSGQPVVLVRGLTSRGGCRGGGSWSFRVDGAVLNFLYYADAYGVHRIHMGDLAGESQDAATTILSVDLPPPLPTDQILTLSGAKIGDNTFLLASMPDDGGVIIVRNDSNDRRTYLDGYDAYGAQMTPDGIMYVINRTLNRVEVYYGADFRPGDREPDFVYDAFSSPAIVDGVLQDIHIAPGYSDARSGSTRLYVSSTTGFARVDTYEVESADGYSAGMDGHGLSWTYGVRGSGKDYEAVGHPTDPLTPSQVIAIHSDEEEGVIFAVTNDGSDRGGLTQISISGNRRILFMDKGSGLLPSNLLRDVYGKI